jgi:putative membrane protein
VGRASRGVRRQGRAAGSALAGRQGLIEKSASQPAKDRDNMLFLLRCIINALALLAVTYLYDGVKVDDFTSALIAAVVLGVVNAVLRPIFVILTLPVTILTFGLFLFVINALLFWLVASIVPGFNVAGFWAAMFGSILFSIITLLTSWLLGSTKNKK